MNDIRALLSVTDDKEHVLNAVEQFKVTFNDFKDAHVAVQRFLSPEIKENESKDWYEPKMEIFEEFLVEVARKDPQKLVGPQESVSNVSKQTNKTKCSHQTAASSSSSTRLKIAIERAALQARMSALKEKHEVEMEKNKLQAQLERMEPQADIAASDAKLKGIRQFPGILSATRRGWHEFICGQIYATTQ